jgi:PAS domain S-box-containing protein
MMETSENLDKMPLNPDGNQKQDRTFEHPSRKTPWLLLIPFVFLAAAVAGFVWHDLTLSYQDSVTHWKVLLTNSANDTVGLADMWLREREMNAEFVAANPLTSEMLVDAARDRTDAGKRQTLEQDLKRTTSANGFLGGLVLDLQCRIVANSDAQVTKGIELETICKNVYRTKSYHVLASGLDQGDVRLTAAVPVFAESALWPSGRKIHSMVGIVALVANPWKTLLPFFVPEGEPAKSLETSLIWKRQDQVVIFFPARAARGEKAVIVRPLKDVSYEGRAAVGGGLAFGEFKDFRGVPVFGVAKQIPLSGDNLARTIDRDEALAEFHRQVVLESFAGILVLVLFGFLAAAVHRHTATKELIEKLKQQEALLALKKDVEISEQRYRDIFENANDVILTMGFDGRIISMNKSAERLSGYMRGEALGGSILDIIAPEHRGRTLQVVQDLLAGKKVPLREVVIQSKDGQRVYVEANRQLIYKDGEPVGIQVIARDITDRKRAEQELQEEKAFTDAVVKSLPGAFFVIDRQGQLVRWNQGVESLGYSSQELVGVDADTLMAEEDRPLAKAKREQAFAEGRAMAEGHVLTRDGLKIPYLFTAQRAIIGDHEYVIGTGIDITERKRMIEALRENEDRYRDLVEHSHALMSTHDLEGRLLSVNIEAARILGYSTEELLKIKMPDLLPSEFRGQFQDYLVKIRSEGAASGLLVVQTRTGERRIWEYSNTLRTEGVVQPIVRGVAIDITERKRAEEALRQSESRYRGLVASSPMPMLITTTPPEERILLMNRRFTELFGYTLAEVKDVKDWWLRAYPDIARRKEVQKAWDERVAAASAAGREAIEPIEVDITCLDGSRRQVEIHMNIIGNGTLVIFNDLTDRKKAQAALLESEERFRRLSDASFEGIAFTDAGKLFDTNRKLAEMLGYDQQELIGMDISRLVAPESLEEVMAHIRSESESPYENLIVRKDGTIFPVETKARYLPWKGKRVRVTAIRDITERKKAEEALRESEERFRQMAVHSPYAFFLWDVNKHEHAYVSPAYETIWGLTPESLYVDADGWKKAVHPDDRERMERHVLGDFQSHPDKEGIEDEFRIIRPDGSIRWVQMHRFPVRNESEDVYRIGLIAQDVTERKNAELALMASEASLAEAQRIGQMGSWEYNALTDSAIWSDELFHLYGLTSDQKEVKSEAFLKLIHPDDRDAFIRASDKAQREEPTFYAEFRIIRADGAVRFLQARAEVIRDSSGRTLGMIGTNQDVTERVRADEALRQREKELEEAQRLAKVGSWAMDIQTGAVTLSEELYRILGIDLKGPTPTLETIAQYYSRETWTQFQAAARRTLETGEPFVVEGALNLAGGTKKWVLSRGEVQCDANGNPVCYRGTTQDITERKEAEEALRSSQEMFFKAFHSSPEPVSIMTLGEGRFIDVNKAFSDQLGYTRAEVIGHTVDELGLQPLAGLTTEESQLWEQGALRDLEVELFTKFGEVRTALVSFEAVEIGGVACILAQGRDITEHRRAEKALRASDERYRAFISHSQDGVWRVELDQPIPVDLPVDEALQRLFQYGWFAECNDAMARINGATRAEEIIGKRIREFIPPSEIQTIESFRSAIRGRWQNRTIELQREDRSGFVRTLLRTEVPIIENGRVMRIWGITRDVTELKQAEDALRRSETSLAEAQRIALAGSWEWDIQTNNERWSDGMFLLLGMPPAKFDPTLDTFMSHVHPDDREGLVREGERAQKEKDDLQYEYRAIRADGAVRIFQSRAEIVRDAAGNPVRMLGATQDVTERKRAEEELKVSEARYKTLIEGAPEAIVAVDPDAGIFVDFNENAMHLFGLSKDELLKVGPIEVSPPVQPDGRSSYEAAHDYLNRAMAGENPVFEWTHRSAYGKDIPCEIRLVRLPAAGRNLVRGSITDITERKQVEEERSRLVSIVESSGDPIVGASTDGFITDWNAAAERVYGYTAEEIHGKHITILAPPSGTSEIPVVLERINQGERISDFEAVSVRKDGTEFPVSITMSAIRNSQGEILGLSGIIRDITSRKRLEEQVTLSQKMESVGRLAGGVAHDFNNMLQIIHGYSELVLDQLAEEDSTRGHVQEIKTVVERAAGLTRQLLAFGRQQVLSPQVMDLNVAITHLSKMLRRLIGEDINLEIRGAKDLGRVKADPGQIDQVIMNLAVNARDAMPKGGKLSIESANVQVDSTFASGHFPMTPGKYVMISVSDTGIGMDAATQARIFEPFFTTKEKGKGTGLGLATVYGIVKQSGGYIWVQSELGRGSTFRVYLPPVKEAAPVREVKQVRALKGGTETVLLVEDEENVRLLVRRSLQSKGYTVLEAQNGKDALRVARQHQGPIHLLMTDVVMPGMGGRELSERLIRLRGEMKTLYMSGYADDAIHHHGVLNPGTELLQKPFSADVLANKVREVLKGA